MKINHKLCVASPPTNQTNKKKFVFDEYHLDNNQYYIPCAIPINKIKSKMK